MYRKYKIDLETSGKDKKVDVTRQKQSSPGAPPPPKAPPPLTQAPPTIQQKQLSPGAPPPSGVQPTQPPSAQDGQKNLPLAIPTSTQQEKKPALTEEEKKRAQEWKQKQMEELKELERKTLETMRLLENSLPKEQVLKLKALKGDVMIECPSPTKIVRIFTSSTFTDTRHERNMLMKYAYPRVKEHCRQIGYEFQVVDMRWGIRDEAMDDHMTTELCMKELKLCQKLSTGPNFVSLLSHKYGYTPFPRVIVKEEYDALMDSMQSDEAKALFLKWYRKDENAVPEAYILSSISTHIPDFLSPDQEKSKVAKDQWWAENEIMQNALHVTAPLVFDAETARKFVMSVTETEVHEGLLNAESDYSLWLRRTIEDIEQQETSRALSRFIECLGPEDKVMRARRLLQELKEQRMQQKLREDQILNYNVHWNQQGGINPDSDRTHKDYLEVMCEDFIKSMIGMVDKSVSKRPKMQDHLAEELFQHTRFCQSKLENFCGRGDILQKMKDYLLGPSQEIFVLHGPSGTGKTSIMAMAIKQARQWLGQEAVIMFRFLGTSPDSSTVKPLLHSMTSQILAANYKTPVKELNTLEKQVLAFKVAQASVMGRRRLVMILDSLDQLDSAYGARQLSWLISSKSVNTKIIVSTLPEAKYECFPALQNVITEPSNIVGVPELQPEDVKNILCQWLSGRSRCLTKNQMDLVLTAFQKCPTPLFLKLSFEVAVSWASHLPADQTILQDTVRSSIEYLFKRLEKNHGQILVSHALAYLTLAKNGLSEAELEDILSCDDEVLNDVYMYWTPPMRRLPPLLLVRIRNDISQYIVERGADGVRVIYWYHRQFIEAAEARYCSDNVKCRMFHSDLADFFQGKWANGKLKEFTSKTGERGAEDRHVSQQPLMYGEKQFNLRTLNNHPYHRLRAGDAQLLETECLANINFMIHKIKAMPLYYLLDDYEAALEAFPNATLMKEIRDVLQLSQKALSHDPEQVVSQLLGRLKDSETTHEFLGQCLNYGGIRLMPSVNLLEQPGGQLVHCISTHKQDVNMMDMTADEAYAITVCQSDSEAKIWNLKQARLLRTIFGEGPLTEAFFCDSDRMICFKTTEKIFTQEVTTGKKGFVISFKKKAERSICMAGKNKELIVMIVGKFAFVYKVTEGGKLLQTITYDGSIKFGYLSLMDGSENYAAVSDNDQYFLTVLDLKKMEFLPKFRGFPTVLDEDGEEEEQDVDSVTICPDETHLVYCSFFTSEVVFADFHGNKLRSIPGNSDWSYSGIHYTPDCRYLYLRESERVVIIDAQAMKVIDSLDHPKSVEDVRVVNVNNVMTIADDCNLRIWDRTRAKLEKEVTISTLGLTSVNDWLLLENSRYILAVGRVKKDSANSTLKIYDIIEKRVTRQHEIDCPDSIQMSATRDPARVLIQASRRWYTLDLQTMQITTVFQGIVDKFCKKDDSFVTPNNKLICKTRSGKGLKVYSMDTGMVESILSLEGCKDINYFKVDSSGKYVGINTECGPHLLVEIETQKILHKFHADTNYGDEYMFGNLCGFNSSSTLYLMDCETKLPGCRDTILHLLVWDIKEGKELCRLYDKEFQLQYEKKKSDNDTNLDTLEFLDDDHVLTTSYDNVMRVYHIRTGKLLHRLTGHTSSIALAIRKNLNYFLTYGSLAEEDCIKLWDKSTFKCLASFTLDVSIVDVNWSSDGKFFFSRHNKPKDFNIWQICHGAEQQAKFSVEEYPKVYDTAGEAEHGTIVFPDVGDLDKDNPDTEPEPPSDDDDDNDDD